MAECLTNASDKTHPGWAIVTDMCLRHHSQYEHTARALAITMPYGMHAHNPSMRAMMRQGSYALPLGTEHNNPQGHGFNRIHPAGAGTNGNLRWKADRQASPWSAHAQPTTRIATKLLTTIHNEQ